MIQAFRYEPQGQRQRFERQEQDRHIHLHVHLHLTFRVRQRRSTTSNAIRLRRIFAALLAATVMPLCIFLWTVLAAFRPLPTLWANLVWVSSGVSVVAGLALALCAVGALLRDVWRASPRGRLGLVLPLVLLLLIPIAAACFWFGTQGTITMLWLSLLHQLSVIPLIVVLIAHPFSVIPLIVVLIAHPFITALLLERVSREASTLREIAPTHSKLGFVVVGGMVLVLLGGLLLNLSFMLSGGIGGLISLPAICLAVIVTSVRLSRSCGSTQARPKEASPFDIGSPGGS